MGMRMAAGPAATALPYSIDTIDARGSRPRLLHESRGDIFPALLRWRWGSEVARSNGAALITGTVANARGTDQRSLPGLAGPAVWLSRGERLLGYGSVPGDRGLYSVKMDGSDRRLVSEHEPNRFDVSSRGDLVSEQSGGSRPNGLVALDLFVSRRTAATPRRITRDGRSTQPSWSPNGRRIAFARTGRGRGLYLIDPDGTDRRPVYGKSFPGVPTWSPDGRWIAFVREIRGVPSIYAIRPDGSGLRPIYRGRGGSIGGMSWRSVRR